MHCCDNANSTTKYPKISRGHYVNVFLCSLPSLSKPVCFAAEQKTHKNTQTRRARGMEAPAFKTNEPIYVYHVPTNQITRICGTCLLWGGSSKEIMRSKTGPPHIRDGTPCGSFFNFMTYVQRHAAEQPDEAPVTTCFRTHHFSHQTNKRTDAMPRAAARPNLTYPPTATNHPTTQRDAPTRENTFQHP